MAGIQGFEPRFSDPESDVLPLDDIPKHYSFREHGYLSIGDEKKQAPKKLLGNIFSAVVKTGNLHTKMRLRI